MEPAESPPILLGLDAVVVLVLANAFFVAAEFALVGARKTRLDEMAKAGTAKLGWRDVRYNRSTATSRPPSSASPWPPSAWAGSASRRWPR